LGYAEGGHDDIRRHKIQFNSSNVQ
jgi:hypothetical protein